MKERHKCNCCGYYTLSGSAEDIAWDICPVCFWENDISGNDTAEYSGANHMTLAQGRENYYLYGACAQNMVSHVRPPASKELSGKYISAADKIKGGFFGLLIGDALGVPYEFHSAGEIPSFAEIEMTPPSGFVRSHSQAEPGTWSDDGAQALCLCDSLLACGRFSLSDFADRLSAWYEDGLWAVGHVVFDVGIQTGEALSAYRRGLAAQECGLLRPDGKGNGALMRALPLALWHRGTDSELVLDAHKQCLITHGHLCNQVCSALYCLTARYLLSGLSFHAALREATGSLRKIYTGLPDYEQELEWSIRPEVPWEGRGSGYVVDCLKSSFMIMSRVTGYEEAVRQAVMLGDDTDTTACVTGGLAGILFGFEDIPKRWYEALKEKSEAERLLQGLELLKK